MVSNLDQCLFYVPCRSCVVPGRGKEYKAHSLESFPTGAIRPCILMLCQTSRTRLYRQSTEDKGIKERGGSAKMVLAVWLKREKRGGVLVSRFKLVCLFEWKVPQVVVERKHWVVWALHVVSSLARCS